MKIRNIHKYGTIYANRANLLVKLFLGSVLVVSCGSGSSSSSKKNAPHQGEEQLNEKQTDQNLQKESESFQEGIPLFKASIDSTDSEFALTGLSVSNDGKLVTFRNQAIEDKIMRQVWSIENDRLVWESDQIEDAYLSGSGDLIILKNSKTNFDDRLYEVIQHNLTTHISSSLYSEQGNATEFTYKGSGMNDIAIRRKDSSLRTIDTAGNKLSSDIEKQYCSNRGINTQVILSSKRKYFACMNYEQSTINVYESATMSIALSILSRVDLPIHFDISPDEQKILYEDMTQGIKVFDIASGQLISERVIDLQTPQPYVFSFGAFFSNSGDTIITPANSVKHLGTSIVLSLDTETLLKEKLLQYIPNMFVNYAVVSPDRSKFATVMITTSSSPAIDQNNHVYVWTMPE